MASDPFLSPRFALAAWATVAVLLVAAGAIAVGTGWAIERTFSTVVAQNVPSLRAVAKVQIALFEQKGLVSNFLHEPEEERWLEELEDKRRSFEEGIAGARRAAYTDVERRLVGDIQEHYRLYDELRREVVDLALSGRRDEALALHLEEVPPALEELGEACEALLAVNEALITASEEDNRTLLGWVTVAVWGGIAGALALGGAAGWLAARAMTRWLVAAAKLAAMGEMAGSVAHEVRNPLTAIMLRLDALALEPELGERAREDIAAVQEELLRVERIVGNFLNLARRPEARRREVEPGKVVTKARELAEPVLRSQGLRLETRLEEGLPALWADPEQVHEVLLNLLLNAAQATPSGGLISIAARARGEEEVEIEVRDSGPGIPDRLRQRVFQPFFTTRPGGVGLGLSIVRGLVELQGGTIELDPFSGSGACFRIRLRAREREGVGA